MRVLLILPPNKRLIKVQEVSFPLGQAYLASILRKEGHTVQIYNADLDPEIGIMKIPDGVVSNYQKRTKIELDDIVRGVRNDNLPVWDEVRSKLREHAPDVVGISVTTWTYESSMKVASICKQWNSNVKIVMGGHHPSSDAGSVLENGDVDFVVRGEGEVTFRELLELQERGEDVSEIRGISYLKNGRVVDNEPRQLIKDLDVLPLPSRDLIVDKECYPGMFDIAAISVSRGCPFKCGFCSSAKVWGSKVRYRTVDNVINEMRFLKETYGTKRIYFNDDTFTVKKKYVTDLCHKMLENGLEFEWICMSRGDCLDEELLKLMKQAGCISVYIGVESGSQRVLNFIRKDEKLNDMTNACEMIKNHGLLLVAFFMVGMPTETMEEMLETFELMKRIDPYEFYLSVFNPTPGTALFDYVVKEIGATPDELLRSQFSLKRNHLFMKDVTEKQFEETVKSMVSFALDHNEQSR